jgi:class 3 adenylate cyclase
MTQTNSSGDWLSRYRNFLSSAGLFFPNKTDEALFFNDYVDSVARLTQFFLAVGGLAFLKYVEQDCLIDSINCKTANNIRYFYSTPLIGLCVLSLFFKFFRDKIEYIVVFNGFVIISAQAWIFSTLQNGYNFANVGFAVIFLALSIAFIIRVTFLGIIAMFSLIGMVGGHIWANNASPGWIVINTIGISTAVSIGMVSTIVRERFARIQFMSLRQLDASRTRAEEVLSAMLPDKVAERIMAGEKNIADIIPQVSIVFADVAGFTSLSRRLSPTDLIRLLDNLFSRFDAAAQRYGMEKITTIGDAYMAVGGMDAALSPHELARNAARFALDIRDEIIALIAETNYPINLRVGVHIGPIIAGIVGDRRPTFDCWGDNVRIARGLENHAGSGQILVSNEVVIALGRAADIGAVQSLEIHDIVKQVSAVALLALRDSKPV